MAVPMHIASMTLFTYLHSAFVHINMMHRSCSFKMIIFYMLPPHLLIAFAEIPKINILRLLLLNLPHKGLNEVGK